MNDFVSKETSKYQWKINQVFIKDLILSKFMLFKGSSAGFNCKGIEYWSYRTTVRLDSKFSTQRYTEGSD